MIVRNAENKHRKRQKKKKITDKTSTKINYFLRRTI